MNYLFAPWLFLSLSMPKPFNVLTEIRYFVFLRHIQKKKRPIIMPEVKQEIKKHLAIKN